MSGTVEALRDFQNSEIIASLDPPPTSAPCDFFSFFASLLINAFSFFPFFFCSLFALWVVERDLESRYLLALSHV